MTNMIDTADVLTQLRTEDASLKWCGNGGLFQRAADEIERLREIASFAQTLAATRDHENHLPHEIRVGDAFLRDLRKACGVGFAENIKSA
jgi:hypothetical protein